MRVRPLPPEILVCVKAAGKSFTHVLEDDGLTTCACGTDAGPSCPCPHGQPLCAPCEECGRQ